MPSKPMTRNAWKQVLASTVVALSMASTCSAQQNEIFEVISQHYETHDDSNLTRAKPSYERWPASKPTASILSPNNASEAIPDRRKQLAKAARSEKQRHRTRARAFL